MSDIETRDEVMSRLREGVIPTLIGLGAIGSWAARWLTANGIGLRGYDDDIVALKNLAAGAFKTTDVGRYKSSALDNDHPRTIVRSNRWSRHAYSLTGSGVMVCADHGVTRREAAKEAVAEGIPFYCAKANGAAWQVWTVKSQAALDDFLFFDEAAEADPVRTPCGESTVGRVASIGAAAELLSAWTGLDITPAEVEASFGVEYDHALVNVLTRRWADTVAEAEEAAKAAAEKAFKEAIDAARERSDEEAQRELRKLRAARRSRKQRNRSTIHQRAIVYLDRNGEGPEDAARSAMGRHRYLTTLIAAEAKVKAEIVKRELVLPDSIDVTEVMAS